MSLQFSESVRTRTQSLGGGFSAQSLELEGEPSSPVLVVDDFKVTGRPFGPHPHAGFSAITYVFEDSKGSLRNRDSLGHHLVIGAGGVCWLQAGRGAMHEEIPAEEGTTLHGLQVFVNLSSKNKMIAPAALWLEPAKVPVWQGPNGDRVRVPVGSFENVSSPLAPVERFDLLDVQLARSLSYELRRGNNAVLYLVDGAVTIQGDGGHTELTAGHGLVISGAGRVTFSSKAPAHFILLSGIDPREPVLVAGPFIMNDRSQVEAAYARFRSGEMGSLGPYAG